MSELKMSLQTAVSGNGVEMLRRSAYIAAHQLAWKQIASAERNVFQGTFYVVWVCCAHHRGH